MLFHVENEDTKLLKDLLLLLKNTFKYFYRKGEIVYGSAYGNT